LHFKKVPVLSDTIQQVVKEPIKIISEIVSYKDNMVSESNFMLGKVFAYFILDNTFAQSYIFEAFLNFFLQRSFEIKLVDRIKRNYRMQKMVCIKTLRTNFLLTF